MKQKGFAPILVLFFVVAVLVAGGIWYYEASQSVPSSTTGLFDPTKAIPLISVAKQQFENLSALSVIPVAASVTPATVSSTSRFSYYGMTFDAPWRTAPSIKTSSPNNLFTILNFGNSHILEAFNASSSIGPIAAGARLAYLNGLSADNPSLGDEVKNKYTAIFDSNYDFVSASLFSSPDQLSLEISMTDESLIKATGLLRTKEAIVQQLTKDIVPIQNISAIHSFKTSGVKGFEFDGSFIVGTTTESVAHLLIFDSHDEAHDLLIASGTRDEIDFVIGSVKVN